ncbi:MAG: hypothetical protein RJB39_155 [Candidatus Parcubacteria bacterium]
MFTLSEWKKKAAAFGDLSLGNPDSRAFNRFMFGGAVEVDVDSAGRILIPDFLREYTSAPNQSDKKSPQKLVFAGIHTRIEIWEETRWKEYKTQVMKQVDTLAAKLGEAGAI